LGAAGLGKSAPPPAVKLRVRDVGLIPPASVEAARSENNRRGLVVTRMTFSLEGDYDFPIVLEGKLKSAADHGVLEDLLEW
jgi:hypothetical protein